MNNIVKAIQKSQRSDKKTSILCVKNFNIML